MVWLRILLNLFILAVAVSIGFSCSKFVKYQSVVDLLGGLQNASAMIFAIAGIWLAYLYPNAIAGLIKNEKVDFFTSKQDAKRIEGIVYIIIMSALVLLGVIAFYYTSALFKYTPLYSENRVFIKSIAIAYVTYLIAVQAKCVILLILRNVSFINRLFAVINDKELEDKL